MQFSQPLFEFDQAEKISSGMPLALAVGVFDGVHSGHRQIIKTVRDMANRHGALACAITFEPHPRALFGTAPELLVPVSVRRELLREAGADLTGTVNFTSDIANLDPEEFLLQLVNDSRFELAGICVGEHWHFGSRGRGGKELIEEFSSEYDFEFCAVPELNDGNDIISSSLIRNLVKSGNLERASKLLCRNVFLYGHVAKGFGVAGRELAAPTANLEVEFGVVPADGVYAAKVHLDGCEYAAAVNIGVAPTYQVGVRRVEIHLLDWHGDLYGKQLALEIVKFIRNEKLFQDALALKEQISKDIVSIRHALQS